MKNHPSPRWSGWGAVLALAAAGTLLGGPNTPVLSSPDFPAVDLPAPASGPDAVAQLGARLPALAQAYGLEAHALRLKFQTDPTLHVDRGGRLHYVEPPLEAGAPAGASSTAAALPPLSETFKLHSKPGASKIIYLDFNGHVLTGTAWNSGTAATINAPAFSIDGDPSTFNNDELTRIQYIWQRVAEDFAPFDVDVTTELTSEAQITRSNSSDTVYGTRVLISPISAAVGFSNAGGVAYLGVFDDIGDFYKPALVFPENLGPNVESYIAEAASHEVGHNFNLNHDGSPTTGYYEGHGIWAPIMGVGYYRSLVQWSKGEYANANNTEDDLAIISSYVGYRADDHGNTPAAATYLPQGVNLQASGIIANSLDADVLAFSTGTGTVSLTLDPDDRSPNLDIAAELRDAGGNTVATSNPLNGVLSASFNLSLNAGTYFLVVRGIGEGSAANTGYSSYASIGQYTLTGTVPAPGPQPPVAAATATPSTVPVGSPIAFNGTGSFDPDGGSITSYAWSFSDGFTADTATVNRTLTTAGTYTVTLTVTDDEGVTGSTTISYIVNTPPTAAIAVSPGNSGTAPFAVNFSGSASTSGDPGDNITSYAWNFGDGTTGSGVSVSKTYNNPGTFNVVLTVTDSRGATATAQVAIVVSANPATTIRVASITLAGSTARNGNKTIRATVRVTNLNGTVVSGVTVTGNWSGAVSGSGSATTGTSGDAVLTSRAYKGTGTVTFTVTGLSRSGNTYSPANNVVTSRSITY